MSLDSRTNHEAATKRYGASLPRPAPEEHAPGAVIAGKYRLERLLGEGGGGSVWQATNLQLEIPVAIKLLRSGPAQRELGERLRMEARAAARLVHPSIVRVFDIGEANPDEPFIVMELLTGESLSDRIYRQRLTAIEAVRLLLPIAEALSVAHTAGVVHRDLKPDNVILCPEGEGVRPKLLDFGIAKVVAGGAKRANITQRGMLVGSPSYMSPEQARGAENVDFRADIWSFCVVLYEALSGTMPFQAPDGAALLRAVIQDSPKPLLGLPGMDRQLWSLIEQGLSKPPGLRPSSMAELGRELARWLRRHGVEHDAAGTPLDAKWLPRAGLAVAPYPSSYSVPRATMPSLGGQSSTAEARRPGSSYAPSTFEPVFRPRAKGPRRAKKAKPGDDRLLVLGATVATLAALFVGVGWSAGAFDDDPPRLAAARFEAPLESHAAALGLARPGEPRAIPPPASAPPHESAPANATRPREATPPPEPPASPREATPEPPAPPREATPEPPAPPREGRAAARVEVVPQPPAPAARAPAAATPVATPVSPSPSPAAAKRPASTKPVAPSLTTALNSLTPPPPRRGNGEGRAPKLRTDGDASRDLMVPY